MRHLITGGSGFIGNLTARRLLERGEQVRVLDIWSDATQPKQIEFVHCSVLNKEGVAAAMRDVDVVHHNAALVAQTDAGRAYWDVNVEGTRIVTDEAAKAGVKSLIHVSSTAAYGIPPAGPITAATPLNPVEPYGKSKLAGEKIAEEICRANGIKLVTIRPRATLGAGRTRHFSNSIRVDKREPIRLRDRQWQYQVPVYSCSRSNGFLYVGARFRKGGNL